MGSAQSVTRVSASSCKNSSPFGFKENGDAPREVDIRGSCTSSLVHEMDRFEFSKLSRSSIREHDTHLALKRVEKIVETYSSMEKSRQSLKENILSGFVVKIVSKKQI